MAKLEYKQGADGKFYVSLIGGNGETMWHSQGLTDEYDARVRFPQRVRDALAEVPAEATKVEG